jgi:hypothetical protein
MEYSLSQHALLSEASSSIYVAGAVVVTEDIQP